MTNKKAIIVTDVILSNMLRFFDKTPLQGVSEAAAMVEIVNCIKQARTIEVNNEKQAHV